jgi:hypothetical protein
MEQIQKTKASFHQIKFHCELSEQGIYNDMINYEILYKSGYSYINFACRY